MYFVSFQVFGDVPVPEVLSNDIKETLPILDNFIREFKDCQMGAMNKFKDNMDQVYKDSTDCLKSTDNLISLQI